MRARELREALRDEGLVPGSPQPLDGSSQPAAAMTPALKAWLNGDLDDPNSPA